MTDIVERLRGFPGGFQPFFREQHVTISTNVLLEAADEIERLRHENDALRNGLDGADRLSNAFAETACRRGARLQLMREWMESKDAEVTTMALDAPDNYFDHFLKDNPEAAEWFDEDGVPR